MTLSGGITHPTLYKKGVTGIKDYWDAFNTQIDTGLDLLNQLSALHLSPPYQAWHFSVCGNSYAVNENWFRLWYFTPLITAMWLRKLTILLKLRQSTSRSLLGALWPVLVCASYAWTNDQFFIENHFLSFDCKKYLCYMQITARFCGTWYYWNCIVCCHFGYKTWSLGIM